MEKLFVEEKIYQQIKKKMCKSDDYFNEIESDILSQFLSQRQREIIKNYKKIYKVLKNT